MIQTSSTPRTWRRQLDRGIGLALRAALFSLLGIITVILLLIAFKGRGAWNPSTFFGLEWQPAQDRFGLLPFLLGSLMVTVLTLLLATPICLLSALYLSEYATRRTRDRLRPFLDVLAGVPSVVFGLFGVIFFVPLVRQTGQFLGLATSGYSVLAGALVLALMVSPYILSVALEVFLAVPREAREAALSLGATPWETARHVVLRQCRPGIVAALVVGFARAFGETLAVLMVVGNVAQVPGSPFAPAYPLPALIANTYGEMMSVPHMDAVLMTAALLLLIVTGGVSLGASLLLRRFRGGRAC